MSPIPWWALPLVAVVFALAGAGVALLVQARTDYARSRYRRTKRWYTERKSAYVDLMAVFERVVYRLRTEDKTPDAMAYLGEVGPPLAQVRLLASGPVRSAALAVHLQLEQLHATNGPAPPGVEPQKHVRELLAQVPLVMQELEAAIREELEIRTEPPQRNVVRQDRS
ncbi:hypothetical protein AB0M54_41355 [Actinoplanes sp. NPDC051470]|uniref:hypothetical protein n=1 Tax=unclassified Actinoplanes TaxID=2626549 RepID=UPI00342F72ED